MLYARDDDNRGLLAVEVRGRFCPKEQIVRALRKASDVPWSLILHKGVADKVAVLAYIERAEPQSIEFLEYGIASDGQRQPPRRKSLKVMEMSSGFLSKVRNELKTWPTLGAGKKTSAVAKAMKQFVLTETVAIDFDDVAVEVDDGNMQRRLTPRTDYSRFTYSLGDDLVDDDVFFREAEAACAQLIADVQSLAEEDSRSRLSTWSSGGITNAGPLQCGSVAS
ncbi:hypothetical protein GC722_05445 [Auraticoccus sp. F435]|uniref:Uncharacterized protein n=1 Tax=Auraticoccus cholistanensis TaxID=2656650 RepID=A0A6A9UUQ7_9ACTN|nr:hypothetical protein [Auraticoccus cholistanensis]MVA75475.1 hypothetical protein [Auraticoccus cholistanensis]